MVVRKTWTQHICSWETWTKREAMYDAWKPSPARKIQSYYDWAPIITYPGWENDNPWFLCVGTRKPWVKRHSRFMRRIGRQEFNYVS